MMTYGGVDVSIHVFLTLESDGGEYLASPLCFFTLGKKPQYPLDMRLGGPQNVSARHGENS
jgi:hypothetical protein